MTIKRPSIAAAVVSTLLFTAPHAQQFDMDAMTRWGNAKQVRFHIVGAYQAPTPIAFGETTGQADVTDGVVVDLDWDLKANAILGTARFQNTKSVAKNPRNPDPNCPAPTPQGEYEHMDATGVRSSAGVVELVGTTSFPLIDVTDCQGSRVKKTVAAKQAPALAYIPIPAPTMLAMPTGATGKFSVSADRKSFTVKVDGWNWTYTPSLIK